MSLLIIIGIIYAVCELTSYSAKRREERRKEAERKMREEIARQKAETQALLRKQREMEREQARIAKEQERQRKEQERQTAQLAKHEEQIAKLEQKMSLLEDEMRFNEHQRGSVSKLLNIAEEERDCLIKGSKEWQRAHKKVIALENQYHTYDKRLKKAMSDYKLCAMQKSA